MDVDITYDIVAVIQMIVKRLVKIIESFVQNFNKIEAKVMENTYFVVKCLQQF